MRIGRVAKISKNMTSMKDSNSGYAKRTTYQCRLIQTPHHCVRSSKALAAMSEPKELRGLAGCENSGFNVHGGESSGSRYFVTDLAE